MATYEKGLLGPFRGKVGPIVGVNWRGKDIMRSRPKKTSHTPSESQLQQREKFSVVVQFITPIKSVLSRYYGHDMGVRSRLNLATSYTMKEALQWTGSKYEIRYDKFMISKGELQGLQYGSAQAQPNRVVKLEWVDNSGQGMAQPDDQLLAVFYAPVSGLFEVYEQVAERADQTAEITLPAYFGGMEVVIWATFVNDVFKRAASSVYLGEVNIS